jgi:hypothetical protein
MTNEWVIGDSRRDILAKLVRSAGGEVNFVDTEYHLLKKYLQLIKTTNDVENDPRVGDLFLDLLRKVVRRSGASTAWMDGEHQLLTRWLKSQGDDTCNCSSGVYELWKRILQSDTDFEKTLGDEIGDGLTTEDGEMIIV